MDASKYHSRSTVFALSVYILMATYGHSAEPSADQALRLRPIQADVDFDMPTAEEIKLCTVRANAEPGQAGWYVYSPGGQLLRRFLDTNGDNRLDRWCYYKGGIEVYRDIDSDFNGKADQYRWLGTAGTRWGLDDGENGVIDRWKMISAEEVTSEVVAALRDRDRARFVRLLPSSDELQSLGLGRYAPGCLGQENLVSRRRFRCRSPAAEDGYGKVAMVAFRCQLAWNPAGRYRGSDT
jgi:hypothetical protein